MANYVLTQKKERHADCLKKKLASDSVQNKSRARIGSLTHTFLTFLTVWNCLASTFKTINLIILSQKHRLLVIIPAEGCAMKINEILSYVELEEFSVPCLNNRGNLCRPCDLGPRVEVPNFH